MKTLKRLGCMMAALMVLLAISSCRTDQQLGFDISGLYGKLWQVDLGDTTESGYELYSEFEFMSGRDSYHGIGYECRYYVHNDKLYDRIPFDWEISRGDLFLDYRDGYKLTLRDILTYGDKFTAYVDLERFRTTFWLVRTRAVTGEEAEAPRMMEFKAKGQSK